MGHCFASEESRGISFKEEVGMILLQVDSEMRSFPYS